ncbi:MAG: TIGR03936 family radical SAM-associated protein [Clostridia bacterium]
MVTIRIWFKKLNTAKYISHLDLCKCMERAIHRAKLPFWYSEGFNPHVFLTINMPISLGYTGMKECMDVKLVDENYSFDLITQKLNKGLPADIQIFDITYPKMKPKEMAYACYEITLDKTENLLETARELMASPEIIVSKKTKKGMKDVDIKPNFEKMKIVETDDILKFYITLPSSNLGSINPRLFFEVLSLKYGQKLYTQTARLNCFNEKMEEFA